MTNPRIARTLAVALAMGTALSIGTAHATIITALASAPQAVAGGYAYNYTVQLTGGQLDPANGTDSAGRPVAPQFGTIYDFGPIATNPDGSYQITTTGMLDQFYWTFNLVDIPAEQTLPTDNPTLTNIRFIYQGKQGVAVMGSDTTFDTSGTPYTVLPATTDNLGTFTIVSPFSSTLDPSALQFDGQTYKGANNTRQSNIGYLAGPAVTTDVPEPASLALLGAALLGGGLLRRRR